MYEWKFWKPVYLDLFNSSSLSTREDARPRLVIIINLLEILFVSPPDSLSAAGWRSHNKLLKPKFSIVFGSDIFFAVVVQTICIVNFLLSLLS